SVKERQPVAALVGANGEILFIDHEGVQLPYSRFLNRADVPLLHGVIANGKIDTASLKVSAEILKNLRSLPEKTLLKTISEVHFNRLTRAFSVVSDAGVEIFLGNETLLPASLQKLNDLWQSQAIDKKTLNELEYIDLRWQGKVITRSRNA
ncbi:MAG TPA: cell division protein FtsQ/DivIB, partial [Patescibacteria group bacterium]|nr:cell division protein FtsQ/DivIB [Patescibacteria group bacterium]